MSDVGSARRVKEQVKAKFGALPWCAGVGVEREDGIGFIVRVSVRPGGEASARAQIPAHIDGVVIKVVETDS